MKHLLDVRFLQIILFSLFLLHTPLSADAFGPNSCDEIYSTNLSAQADYDFDSRLDNLTSASGTINLWTTRGNATSSWEYNPQAWTQGGDQVIDWTGVSPWNSDGGYTKAGTLISPKHVAFATHYQINVGATIIFVDAQGTIISRTITKKSSVTNQDITIAELDSDVPESIAYYPIVNAQTLYDVLNATNLPFVSFDQEDHLIVAESASNSRGNEWLISKTIMMTDSEKPSRYLFNEDIVGGDSGNPFFIIINNQPILVSTLSAVSGDGRGVGPFYPSYINEINAVIEGFGSSETVSDYSISCWNNIVPDTTIPVISSVSSGITTQTGTSITWSTNEVSDSQIEYGLTSSYTASTTLDITQTTTHSVTISDLVANTTYHYRVLSRDIAGNTASSTDYTFITAAIETTNPSTGSSGGGGGKKSKKTKSKSVVTKTSTANEVPEPVTDSSIQTITPPSFQLNTVSQLTSLTQRDLELGMEGEDVKILQQFLNSKGYVINSPGLQGSIGFETNYFGTLTKQALIQYQQALSLVPAVGYFGPKTRKTVLGLMYN